MSRRVLAALTLALTTSGCLPYPYPRMPEVAPKVTAFHEAIKKGDLLGIPYISSASVTRETFVVDLESEEESIVVPAPILPI